MEEALKAKGPETGCAIWSRMTTRALRLPLPVSIRKEPARLEDATGHNTEYAYWSSARGCQPRTTYRDLIVWVLVLFAALGLSPVSALGQHLEIPASEVGPRVAAASARFGEPVSSGVPTCGVPQHQPGTCSWKLGPQLSLTANAYDSQSAATVIVIRWSHADPSDSATRKMFDQTCRGLVAALLPEWPAAKVAGFADELIGSAQRDRVANAEGIEFALYLFSGWTTCEAQLAND